LIVLHFDTGPQRDGGKNKKGSPERKSWRTSHDGFARFGINVGHYFVNNYIY